MTRLFIFKHDNFCNRAFTRFRFFLLTGFLFLFVKTLPAQNRIVQGTVISQVSGEKIPFASISWKKAGTGGLSDSSGAFTLFSRYTEDTLIVSHVGYTELLYPFSRVNTNGPIVLELSEKQTSVVVVNKKYNRGLFWWKKVVQHKPENNPYQFQDFSCDLYKKMEMDLTNITKEGFQKIKLLKPFRFILENMDTVSENKSFLPVFMMESISRFWLSNNPQEKREEVQAFRTSGIKNEVILHFLDGLNQGINVYQNSLILLGKEFVSPFSNDAPSYYNFRGADTAYIGGQRYLHLFFYPKKDGENGFTGDCWIHSDSWAISSINLEISTTANINYVNRLVIKQEFTRINDSSWVFAKNQFIAEIAPLTKSKIAFIARQTSIFQHVRINSGKIPVVVVKNGNTDEVIVAEDAKDRSPEFWNENRPEQLSVNEQKVYQMMDTLHNMPLFTKYSNTMNFIIDGRKKIGKIEIGPWYKWISSNQIEKLRLRFDLGTTEEFSRMLRLHGYLAYGTADGQFNGGIDFKYKFPGNEGYFLRGFYAHDLNNGGNRNGGVGLTMDNMFSQLIRKPGVPQKFYHVDEYNLGFGREWANKFSAAVNLTRGSYQTFAPLPPQKRISSNEQDIINAEVGLNLRYAPGERKIESHRKDYRHGGNKPVYELNYAQGIPGVLESMYTYHKISAQISQTFRIPRWGTVNYRIYGGKIQGEALPFMLLEVHPGNDIYYYSKESFNLMNRFEYLSDEYAGFSVEHDFEKKLINLIPFLRKINVRQLWTMKAVWGNLSKSNKELNCFEYGNSYPMQSLNGKSYMELGTGIDNIFRYFRVDFVWRISPTTEVNHSAINPYAMKPAAQFGIFGSFHIQF